MKKISLLTIGLAVTALLAFRAAKTETYKIDTQKSNIEWTGKKVLGQHNGEITHEWFEFERVYIELQLAGLNLGVIKDVIE